MSANPREIEPVAQFHPKFKPLWKDARYKILYSGRGAGKSWGVARALLIQAANAKLRILCARETQSSIRESVHALLESQIEMLGLGASYRVFQSTITNHIGSEFIFVGLSDQTADTIKSYHNVDICWVEEAQFVTERSWTILTKTIRPSTPGQRSEIWVTFNPEMDTDPTWKRFIANPDPEYILIPLSYRDNPWHSQVMENERKRDEKIMHKVEYDNIWEGKPRSTVAGAIYADEVVLMQSQRRVGTFPYDSFLPAFAVFDLGWNESTAIIIAQRHQSALRIIHYIEDDHATLDEYSYRLRNLGYPITRIFLPHDGAAKSLQTGQSAQEHLQGLSWGVEILPASPIEDGIRTARMAFRGVYVDQSCARLIECLRRYRRIVSKKNTEPGAPFHDEFSHGADAFRYACQAAPLMDSFNGEQSGLKLPPLKYGWGFK